MDKQKLSSAALDILKLSRNTLAVNLRFIASAICALKLEENGEYISTDGEMIFYNPIFVAQMYKYARELPTRCYLHLILHCIFRHNFIDPIIEQRCWDLACDIAVECIINELSLPCLTIDRAAKQSKVIQKIKAKSKFVTAEKIYRWLCDSKLTEKKFAEWEALFRIDDHSIWYKKIVPKANSAEKSDDNGAGNPEDNTAEQENAASRQYLADIWKQISENLQTDLETFSKQKGDSAGSLMQNLNAVNREKYDYTAFLKKFSVMGEAMKINDDEFDYIFYTYGMQLYENMPLIEPLEYKEVKRIKEFVIAIDTSGSVKGESVQKFVQKTYNILKQEESFFSKINLHIIQCDTEIQQDIKITSQEEFDEYLKTMTLHGFGGTDFRPAFRYVDNMIKNREFTNLKGMIYFTDGWGDFPEHQPDYHTAFVFVDDDYNNPDVPVWAIKIVLQSDEIQEINHEY